MKSEETFDELITANVALLKFCGLVSADKESLLDSLRRILLAFVAFACLSVYTISYTRLFLANVNYLDTALECFTMILSFGGGQLRYTIVYLLRDHFRRMLNTCENLWSELDPEERRRVSKYARKARNLTYYYLSSCVFTIMSYTIACLVTVLTSNTSTPGESVNSTGNFSQVERNLPYAFVVDVHGSPYYEIVYIFQLFSVMNVGLTCVASDTIGPLLILIACGHFQVVRMKMERFPIVDNAEYGATRKLTREQVDAMQTCIRYHRTVLEFCVGIERLTSILFLTQLIQSTYNISLVGFKLAGNDPDKFKFVMQISIAIMQLFMCNWPPDVLRTQSEAVSRAAYSMPWYQYPSWRIPICLILARAQEPIRLTAGNFVSLSLETFASMVSSAASFFTVVSNMS